MTISFIATRTRANIAVLISSLTKRNEILFKKYRKTCLKRSLLKKTKIGFQDRLSLNAGQKYCRMLQGEHSAILLTFITLPLVITIFILSIFEWPLKTGFTVHVYYSKRAMIYY